MITITCADCGRTQTIPELPPGATAECHRCDRLLARRAAPKDATLALAVAIFFLLPPAFFMPLMASTIRNLVFGESRLVTSVPVIYSEVWFPFAFGFFFFAFLFPALRALLQILVLASLKWNLPLPQRGRIFRWSEELRIWSMTDVVVIAGVAAYYRAAVSAGVGLEIGAWCYIAVAFLSVTLDRTMDRRSIWNAIVPDSTTMPGRHLASCDVCELAAIDRRPNDPCPRCGSRLDRDVAPRFAPAAGAVAAAIPLCIPAFSSAVMINENLTGVIEHTVLGTVQLLADHGYWQIGAVVLICGFALPYFELGGLIWLLASVRFPTHGSLIFRTRLYRLLWRLVRWPMIIPFVAALAAPIVNFRGIDDIVAGPGATPLFVVITLLVFAIRMFEPKLMWRTAGELA